MPPDRPAFELPSAGPDPLPWSLQGVAAGDIYAASQAADNGEYSPLFAGQGLRMLKDGRGAAEVVAEIVDDASAVLARLRRG